MRRFPAFRLCAAVLLSLCCAPLVHAGTYPDHPIKMLTMTKPGAQIDLLTRAVAEKLKASLGQPVLVSNVPGGSHGSVMATELASSPADGYTLGVSATAAFTYSPHFVRTKYGLGDFQFLTLLGLNQSGIICLPDRPWKTLKEAFTWAKKEGKGLTYMFQGSDDRDAMKRIAEQEGVKLSLMPSSGGPSVISAVMGGHADLGHTGAILFDYVQSGKIRCLAASTPVRLTELPDIPTLREQGWDESIEMYVVFAAPKGLPDEVLQRLKAALDMLGLDGSHRLIIVLMQLVNLLQDGQPVRMSKRSGKAIALRDLLDEVSVDAARFFFNSRSSTSALDFDLDLAVREDSENPVYYVQYAHARICSLIARLAEEGHLVPDAAAVDPALYATAEEKALIKTLSQLPEVIRLAARDYDPSGVNRYLVTLAGEFHRFYNACRIKGEEAAVLAARLKLADTVRAVIANCLSLIGVAAPEKM